MRINSTFGAGVADRPAGVAAAASYAVQDDSSRVADNVATGLGGSSAGPAEPPVVPTGHAGSDSALLFNLSPDIPGTATDLASLALGWPSAISSFVDQGSPWAADAEAHAGTAPSDSFGASDLPANPADSAMDSVAASFADDNSGADAAMAGEVQPEIDGYQVFPAGLAVAAPANDSGIAVAAIWLAPMTAPAPGVLASPAPTAFGAFLAEAGPMNPGSSVEAFVHQGAHAAAEPAAPAESGALLASLDNPAAGSEAAIANSSVGAGGATAAQVQQALDESGLSVNGSGIKVGVLSDSFNDLGGAAADEADGALPPGADIDVIKDLASGGTDEGRAMMQIIHDIAPGASLAFYTAFDSEQDFANGILALAAAGCKVIVDDVAYYDEPFFQNGVVARAIQTVEAEGVTYVTAAGNEASNGYQAAWTPISGSYDGTYLTDTESFAGSVVQTVTINTEGTGDDVPLILEWNQAYGAATSDLEIVVFHNGVLYGEYSNINAGQELHNPLVDVPLPSGTYQIAIENLSGPNPGLIKEITEGDGFPATISGANTGTVVGHATTPGAITAGAVSAADTPAFGYSPTSESFSSSGAGAELLFANNGTALSSPDDLSPVAVSGVDDIATTVAGGLSDFYGTSAASASLAGVAALILSANPDLTPAQVEQIMEETALPMANSAVSGAGLVQVDAAVAAADPSPVVTVSNIALSAGHGTVAASSLFTATDPGETAIASYGFIDETGNGHFVLNGVAQASDQAIDVTAAQLSELSYQSAPGTADTVEVRASNGVWSSWESFTVTAPPLVIQTDGSTALTELGNDYYLDNNSTGTGPELQCGGTPVFAGEFAGATPIGAIATATGYEVAWNVGGGDYSVWNTDSSGNYTGHLLNATPGNSVALESLEPSFQQDLNGDGVIGLPTTVIEAYGATSLVEIGNNYYLESKSTGTGPELQYGGAPVFAGEFAGATPIGVEATATGYEVAWNVGGGDYSVWSTDSDGNYTGHLLNATPGNSVALESLEPSFDQDLNGDGTIGIPGQAFSLQYKGFDYVAFYNGAYENADSLPSLAQTGANSIEATLDYGIDVATSQVVADPNYTDSLAALGTTIAQAESLGLSVMVRPLIDFLNPTESAPYSVGEWRQDYQPTNVAAFFASYQQMIVQEAEVAQANGAQMLSIGAELDQLTGPQYLSYWTDIITAVRQVFSGALTYSASWNTANEVSFWSQLNYEGIDNYVPLSNAQNPSLQTLVNGWLQPATEAGNPGAYAVIGNQSPIQYFENLAAQSGKPLLFTELGYANDSGAAADPSASGNSPDPTLQAELYQAFFEAWTQSKSSALVGAYFWEWDPNGSTSNVGPNIDSFSPQNSAAQSAATAGFEALGAPADAQLVLTNASTMEAASGTTLQVDDSTIDNTGNIQVAGNLVVEVSTLMLDGTGTLTLAGGTVEGPNSGEMLYNAGNTIAGTGTIGDGSGHLALDNASGTIEAIAGTLIIDTGTTITNFGTLEAATGATLQILDPVTGTGGSVIGAGAILELAGSDSGTVTFASTTGALILDHPSTFSGELVGFTGDGTLAGSDQIDLRGVNFDTVQSSYDSSTGVLDVSDGTTTVDLKFVGTYSLANFKFADDGSGGTIVYDPPVSGQPTSAAAANDGASQPGSSAATHWSPAGQGSFVFAPDFGQVTLKNFAPATDSIQFSQSVFANFSALVAATHDNAQGNAVITDAAHDTLTFQNVTTAQLLAHQNDFHFV